MTVSLAKTPVPLVLTLQYNRDGSITLFDHLTDLWVGVFTTESHAIQFARKVLGYTGDL